MTPRAERIKETLIQVIPIVVVNSLFISSSLLVPIINHPKSFVPCSLEYLRTFILATLSSALINFGTTKSIHLYHPKTILEFLALLFLAYPQKTEIDQTFSNWNLVKRESYLFGAIFNFINQGFYLFEALYNIWTQEIDENELRQRESTENINELVRQRATLSNCIQVRRNSYNLKKNVYSGPSTNTGYPTENESLLKSPDLQNNTIVVDYNSDSIEFLNPSSTTDGNSKTPTGQLTPIHTNYGSVTSMTSLNLLNDQGSKKRSPIFPVLEVFIWSVFSSTYEIGIALILSITFIFVPDLDDTLFTKPEIFYYNNIKNFLIEVVVPLGILTSSVHYYLLPRFQNSPLLTLLAFSTISLGLYVFGILET